MGKKGGDKAGEKKKDLKDLPPNLAVQHDYVICGPEANFHTSTITGASHYMALGIDNTWDFAAWSGGLRIAVSELSAERLTFDLIGVDPAVANALRRILISEVPTVAIEHVFFVNNTSIMQDEVLAHRLGLVPLVLDAALLERRGADEAPSERNTVVFKMHVTGTVDRVTGEAVQGGKVLSKHLHWLPHGSELPDETSCRFAAHRDDAGGALADAPPPAPVHDDILLTRLQPGQEVELEAHCVVGTGAEHAKWSPVSTAWYRLQPEVALLEPVEGDAARELAAAAPGLFTVGRGGRAEVGSAREHEHLLERVRRLAGEERWRDVLQLRKRKDHFIFTVEAAGGLAPDELVRRALAILAAKCDALKGRL